MITKIRKINGLGIFHDYEWDSELPDLCRYNLIYGWNGCGKTTLSKLFTALEDGKHDKYSSLEYEIETDNKKWKNGENFSEKVRVFNRDYVLANVEKLGGPNPIFILGDENKQLVEQIEKDEKELSERTEALIKALSEKVDLDARRSNIFTDIARTVSQNVSGESTRSYRKPNAEADFSKITAKQILADDDVVLHKGTIAQQQKKPALDPLPSFDESSKELEKIVGTATNLLASEVESVIIERLTQDAKVSEWVERGLALHEERKSKHCEFCNQGLSENRLKELAGHFNDADKHLKKVVDEQLDRLRPIFATLRDLPIREASNVYDELQAEYRDSVGHLTKSRDELIKSIEDLGKKIKDKKSKTTEKLSLSTKIDTTQYKSALEAVNACIKRHNLKTANFEKEKDAARSKLKAHYLSGILDDVKKIDNDIKAKEQAINQLQDGNVSEDNSPSLASLKQRIADNRAKVSSSHKACKEINEKLKKFLGHGELIFEVKDEGYVIKRHDEIAEDLSEGERTAIAFVYFTVQLMDQDFKLEEGIVVIDDPISSLDSNSLFQAFAFLKESVRGARQVFILTHNFEFMRQVKNWFFHIKKVGGNFQRSLYMIKNKEINSKRTAYIAPLDKLLMKYESEYHYLFSLLHNFKEDGTLEAVYNFPNIGRKFLETFLAFKVPSNENIHNKMAHIDYDAIEKTAILRFVETHSHAERSDGALNFDMTLSNGGQKAITSMLSMVEQVDATHYNTLLKATSKS